MRPVPSFPRSAQKTCPFSNAWSETELGGHGYAECGNRGECNRETGECECFDGYEGKGCKRLSCIDGCNNHGECHLMSYAVTGGYEGWDKDKIMTCKCDPGYSGPSCAARMCMRGDDPMSTQDEADTGELQENAVLQVEITEGTGTPIPIIGGSFTLTFLDWRGETLETYPIKFTDQAPTGIEVQEALQALPNHAIPDVTVTIPSTHGDTEFASGVSRKWSITFGKENSGKMALDSGFRLGINMNPCTVQGCQPIVEGAHDAATVVHSGAGTTLIPESGITAAVTAESDGSTESTVCSGRGECDSEQGICECYEGYVGQACESQEQVM